MIPALLALAVATTAPLTWREVMTVCRTFHLEDRAKGKAMYDALPTTERLRIIPMCLTYRAGVLDARDRDKRK